MQRTSKWSRDLKFKVRGLAYFLALFRRLRRPEFTSRILEVNLARPVARRPPILPPFPF